MVDSMTPYDERLHDGMLGEKDIISIKNKLALIPSWNLNQRQLCDIELILNGGFSPLTGFMTRANYESVLSSLRLKNGSLWPIPITLDVSDAFSDRVTVGDDIALRDNEENAIAILSISEKWRPNKREEALAVYGTLDEAHPGIRYLMQCNGNVYLSGRLIGITSPKHYDFTELRHSPTALRQIFQELDWERIVGFQTRNPMHRAHQALTEQARKACQANLLIHPIVGMTKPGDVDYFTRVRCYKKLLNYYDQPKPLLSLLPLAMRMAGPREAMWHALIRKNYGCTHFIVGRDHASPGKDNQGNWFYGFYDAQQLLKKYEADLGIEIVTSKEIVYIKERQQYVGIDEVNDKETVLQISGTELRARLNQGATIPTWFSYPEVINELHKAYPPRIKQGFTIFLTGLSAAGKSTIANALAAKLMETGERKITLIDGDIIRKTLSQGLGFSREDRNLNVQRIGYIASEITKHGGIAVCAMIAPFALARNEVRKVVSAQGGFIEVYVSTPLAVCEQRDPKGLYSKARKKIIHNFTGISDPYEPPTNAELNINTATSSVKDAVIEIIKKLKILGYLTG